MKAKIVPVTSPYLKTNEDVYNLMALRSVKDVTQLVKDGHLNTYRADKKGRVFKVSECLLVAEQIDKGLIVLK